MCIPRKRFAFGLGIVLAFAAGAVAQTSSNTYDAATNFEQGWTTQSNPNGVWSYGYSSSFTGPVTLYTQTAQNGVNGPNAQFWLSPSVNVGNSPAAEFNNGPAFAGGSGNVDLLANQFVLVAGVGGQYSDLVFTAPASGTYSVVASFRGDQTGVGTVVGVVVNNSAAVGPFGAAPGNVVFNSTVTADKQTVPFTTEVSLKAGNTVVFSVGPGGGLQNTGVSATITGPLSQTPSYPYYFSHLVLGGGWQTTLTYINYSPQAVTCVTNFYSDAGVPLSIAFSQGTISTRTDVLQPGQSIHDQTVASLTASVTEGWAQASCTGPVQASLLYRLYQSSTPVGEASVNAETAPTTALATFAETATGVAFANPSTTQSAMITFTVYDATGTRLGSKIVTLGPLAHSSANVGPLLGLQSFTGFVKITSSIPIISLSLNAEAFPVFSSLPPGDLSSSTPLVTP